MKLTRTIKNNKTVFLEGLRNGLPIGLGYFAVSFSLGIVARNSGLSAFQAFLASFLCNASAGEYAGFTLILSNATYIEMAIVTLITNARYLLMSCALSQRMNPETKLHHRLITGYYITDEFFGIAVSREGYLNPYYIYGAILTASPLWWIGTMIGAIMGNLLPTQLEASFSVALYGMFLAVIIPPAKKDKVIAILIIVCFISSYIMSYLPLFSKISDGTRTIVLTVVISVIAAVLFPRNQEGAYQE